MELLDKMKSFLKKKPTKAELERIDKKKVDADRARMEDLRARLDAAGAFPPSANMTDEEKQNIRQYFNHTAACAKDVSAAAFDVTAIDKNIAGIMTILERAMKEGGSRETILRCFQGISYGILDGHSPISENAIESDIVERRTNGVDRYLRIAQYSFEIDQKKKDVDRMKDQKRKLDLQFEEAKDALQEMIREHPQTWYDLKELTPLERDAVTGTMKIMAAKQAEAVHLKKNANQLDLMIGQSMESIAALEAQTNTMFIQQKNWESEIDEMSLADVLRLNEVFKKQMLQEEEIVRKLNDASETMDAMFHELLGGRDVKERIIKTNVEYQELMESLELEKARKDAGRIRYEQEQEELRLKAEQEAADQLAKQGNDSEVLYN